MNTRLIGSVTRPNNTDTYTAGDVIGAASSHIIALQSGAIGLVTTEMIFKATVISSAAPALAPALELWLFNVAPAAQADHAAFAVTDTELLALVGILELTTTYIGYASNNRVAISASNPLLWVGAGGYQNLFGILVSRNAYVPVANEVFTVMVDVA